ncbi:MAG: hypothetical protein GY696_29860 [Gammaproteobacteria bacterium]|nr:hypothetical protein [Gammaproteobacteria bacterium]
MKRSSRIFLIFLLLVIKPTLASADEWFEDQAQVLDVEPIEEVIYERETVQFCEQGRYSETESISADMQGQLLRWQRCDTKRENVRHNRIVGYWVTYRYAGETEVRRMDYDPGDRLAVSVSVDLVD